MGVTIADTRVACNTSTGTQDITTADLGGLTPVAAMFIMSYCVTDGTAADDAALVWGFTDGTVSHCVCFWADHGATTTVTGASNRNSPVFIMDNTGTLDGIASFSQWLTNGVQINWTDAPTLGYLLTVRFFAGTDVSADVDKVALSTQDTEVNVTSPGFEPKVIFGFTAKNITGDSNDGAHWQGGFGASHYDGISTYTQRSTGIQNRNGQTTTIIGGVLSESYGALATTISGGGLLVGVDVIGFDSQGFSAYARGGDGTGFYYYYLALAFNGVIDVGVLTHTTPTSQGEASETGFGFKPQAVLLGTTILESVDTYNEAGLGGQAGLALVDVDEQYAYAINSEDGVTTTNEQSLSDNVCAVIPLHTGAAGVIATTPAGDKFTSNGWTFDYTTVTANGKKWWAVGFEEDVVAALLVKRDSTDPSTWTRGVAIS